MMHKVVGVGFGLIAMAVAGSALAGYKAGTTVTVNTTSRYFLGTVSSARNSADANQYLQAQITGTASTEYVALAARDASGITATCYSYAAPIIAAASTVQPDSFIEVFYDASGVCTTVYVYNASWNPPKNQ
jgi:hypothetical protein